MPLAITTARALADDTAGGAPTTPFADGELDKIVKLIPADVVALYTAALAFGPAPATRAFALSLFFVGLALVPLLLYLDGRLTKVYARAPQYVLRTLAYVAWAFAISDPLAPSLSIADVRWIPGLAILVIPVLGSRLLK